jgi:DNA-binding NarL/FixJ family response regulator
MALRIVIADDHPLVLDAISRALERDPGIDVVGATSSGRRVVTLVGQLLPDIALLDLHMPDQNGIECLELIREHHPQVKVVILSASERTYDIDRALAAGASAYIDKRVLPEDIAGALRQAHQGTVHHRFSRPMAVPAPAAVLTDRELTVLEAISRGASTKSISAELWVTEQTVKFHLGNIYRKLGVAGRAEAMRYAFDNGLLEAG